MRAGPKGFPSLPSYRLRPATVYELRDMWLVGPYATPVTGDGRILLSPYRDLSWSFLEHENAEVIEFVRSGAYRSRVADRIVDEPTLSLVSRFDPNYFHWMTELLPQLRLVEDWSARTGEAAPVVMTRTDAPDFVDQSIAMVGWQRGPTRWGADDRAPLFVRRLIVCTYPGNGLACSARGVRWVRSRLGHEAAPTGEPIFVIRRQGGWRSIRNEDEVLDVLDEVGFRPVRAETMTLAEQLEVYCRAPALAGQHGAGLTNAMFLPSNAPLLELRGEYGGAEFASVASCTGNPHYAMACAPDGDDIVVDRRELRRALSALLP